MSLNVHRTMAGEYHVQGWVTLRESGERVDLAHPDRTCLEAVRGGGGGLCELEPGHRDYHSSQVFHCDGCDRARRGAAYRWTEDVAFCFLCSRPGR